jgi:hypothetical protein
VVLKGLHIVGSGAPAGTDGIHITEAASVHIEDCVIERSPGDGIDTGIDADTLLFVRRTTSRNNGRYGLNSVGINSATAMLAVDSSRFENNGFSGIHSEDMPVPATFTRSVFLGNSSNGLENLDGRASVMRSIAANNGGAGFNSSGQSLTPGSLTVERSISRGHLFRGISVSANATGIISNSVFTNNSIGIENGGTLFTRQNNTNAGNSSDYAGTPPVVLSPQ